MSALDLVAQYSSDSDSEHEVADIPIKFPLPALITESVQNNARIEDPEAHGGRVRSFPHERGNWPTFVYIPCIFDEKFTHFIDRLIEECSSVDTFKVVDNYHISVSRTVILKYHWIPCFISSLKEVLNNIDRFVATFTSLAVFCNDDNTRTFLGLKVDDDQAILSLKSIVNKTDGILADFRLQTYYKDPSFHVSLLWCLGDKRKALIKLLPMLEEIIHSYGNDDFVTQDNYIEALVEGVCCKSGNKLFSINLKAN